MSMLGADVVVAPVTVNKSAHSYMQWGPIIGGAVLATAISTIMTIFGSAIGLSMASASFERTSSATAFAIAGALWALWITVSSSAAGGYVAGRMRQPVGDSNHDERRIRDATHGVLVWATGALLITIIATSALFGAARTAASGIASAGSTAVSLISQNADPLADTLDGILRANGQQPPSAEERSEASRILVKSLANGRIEQADREYLASRLAARSNISQQDAQQKRIDDAYAQLAQAKETAKQTAERARKIAVLSAFLTAAALLVGAAAAAWAAGIGGEHRDENLRVEPVR